MEIKKTTKAWITEFKAFALKGNVIDMAIGVIIGTAFGKIVTSLVNDVVMPGYAILTGGHHNLAGKCYIAGKGFCDAIPEKEKAAILKYGLFCQTVIDFLIIAICIFLAIKLVCKLRALRKAEEKKEEASTPPPPTPEDILLLREIRDSLRKQ